MEQRTETEKPISLSESTRFQQADWKRTEGLADYTQEGRRFVFPDLQSAHVFCTRLSWIAPDAVVQRAMRHSSPERNASERRDHAKNLIGTI